MNYCDLLKDTLPVEFSLLDKQRHIFEVACSLRHRRETDCTFPDIEKQLPLVRSRE